MGKKKIFELGSTDEEAQKAKRAVQLEQKKLRLGKKTTPEVESEITPSITETPTVEKPKAKKQIKIRSKAYQAAKAKTDPLKSYPLPEALKLLRQVSLAKFDGTVELHLTVRDSGSSFTVDLPHSTGKSKTIAVASDEVIAEIDKGQINFNLLLASPAQMPKLVKYAKLLGPRGLMPNPKNGTLVSDPEAAAKKLAASSIVTLKTEKSAPVIHTVVGKLSFSDKDLSENISAILKVVKPIKAVLKSTISPAIKITL